MVTDIKTHTTGQGIENEPREYSALKGDIYTTSLPRGGSLWKRV